MGEYAVRDEWIQLVGYRGCHVVGVVVRLSCHGVAMSPGWSGCRGCRVVGLSDWSRCMVGRLLDRWVDWWMLGCVDGCMVCDVH